MNAESTEALDERVASRLAGRLAGRVQSLNPPWAAQVVSWMALVDLCLEVDENLGGGETLSAEGLALHEAVVSLGIGCGSWLLREIRIANLDISASGQTPETLGASLELLRILHRRRHSQFPPAEVRVVQARIFNAAA